MIEELSMNAWPAARKIQYGGWTLGFTEGYTKRANSVYPLRESPDDAPLAERIAFCESKYREAGLPCIFKIPLTESFKNLDAALETSGYRADSPTSVMTLDLTTFAPHEADWSPVVVRDRFDPAWIEGFITCSRLSEPFRRPLRSILSGISLPIVTAEVFLHNEIRACAFAVLERGMAGIFDVVVKEEYRRRGYGTMVVEAVLSEIKKRGAAGSYLQVVQGNVNAERLYGKIGYAFQYAYHYRIKDVKDV